MYQCFPYKTSAEPGALSQINDPTMDSIKVTIDREKNTISVQNGGKGIPVEMHKKEGIMIPELIFGNL